MSRADLTLDLPGYGEDPAGAEAGSRRSGDAFPLGWRRPRADAERRPDSVVPDLRERARQADALEREVDDLRGLIACLTRDKVRLEEHLRAALAELDETYRHEAALERQLAELRGPEGGK